MSDPNSPWESVEHFKDRSGVLRPHARLRKQRQITHDVIRAFGTDEPPAESFLLHFGRRWEKQTKNIPVLLIHGATDDAIVTSRELPLSLIRAGYSVFAITVPHNQWAIQSWCHHMGNAVEQIKERTGSKQVNLVGISLGGVASLMYASEFREPWMVPYQDNTVKNLIILGAPRGGTDILFRIPRLNLQLSSEENPPNYPMTWTSFESDGKKLDTTKLSIIGRHYPAMRQIAFPWDSQEPVDKEVKPTYYGTDPSHSLPYDAPGIYQTMEIGGRFINRLQEHPVPDSVRLLLIGGNAPLEDMPPGIYRIPHDGYVPVASAIRRLPSERAKTHVFNRNHRRLANDPEVIKVVLETLGKL